jgi:DNA-binding CsgD family transcriptional regulator
MHLLGLSKPIATHTLGLNGFAVDVPRRNRAVPHNELQNGLLRLGDSVTSMLQLRQEQLLSVISFHHGGSKRGDDPGSDREDEGRIFTQRDRRMVRLFHSQMEWMFAEHLPSGSSTTFDSLTPRQQQTLRCLLSGDSEKQIAHKLARSPHTVHTHVKSIYRNLGVSSRGELLSLFVR